MKDSMYRPPKTLWSWIAPTEIDNNLRHRLVQGEVHDENAYSIGGVSGHAGVFSTSPDLAAFCQMMLNGGVYGAPAHPETRHDCGIHDTAAAIKRHTHAGLGGAHRGRLERTLFLEAYFRPHRLHRHVDLDRSRSADFCGAADQPRASHARKYEDRQSARSRARRGHARPRLRRCPCSNSLTVNVSRHSLCCFRSAGGFHSYRTI